MFEARFQSFDDRSARGESAPRLAALRAELKRRGLDGFIVPRADRYQNEYVPPCAERLAWLTGFTGSAGIAIVLADRAVIFVDGRYQVQVREKWMRAVFTSSTGRASAAGLDRGNVPAGASSAIRLAAHHRAAPSGWPKPARRQARSLSPSTIIRSMRIWKDRPQPPLGPVVAHDMRYAGEDAAAKLARIRAELGRGADMLVVSEPQAVSWLFNIRGSDVPHTPVVLAFATVPIPAGRRSMSTRASSTMKCAHGWKRSPTFAHAADFERDLAALGEEHRAVRLDPALCPDAIARLVAENGGKVVRGADPIAPMKAVKNAVEIEGARAAQLRDGAAVTRFLAWFEREAPAGKLTEIDAVEALESFRRETGLLKDISFSTIAGAGPNGAIVHYRVTRKTNRRNRGRRTVSDRFRRPIRRRHHRYHAHLAVGAPSAEMRDNFTLRAQGPYRHRARGLSRRHHRRAARQPRAAIPLARRARFRSRHRPWRRQLSIGA